MLPQATHTFALGLEWRPAEVDLGAWQDHLLRHPLGLEALFARSTGSRRRWNDEGWDTITPPVITLEERRHILGRIGGLLAAGSRCAIPRLDREDYAGDPPVEHRPCKRCPVALATVCGGVVSEISERYSAVTEELLASVGGREGYAVSRDRLRARLFGLARERKALEALTVLSVGSRPTRSQAQNAEARPDLVRVQRSDGVRVELYLSGRSMKWRTTYRHAPGPHPLSALLDLAPATRSAKGALSETCLVPRPWAERWLEESNP